MSLQRHKSALRLFAVFVLLVSAVALFKFSDTNSAIAPIALTLGLGSYWFMIASFEFGTAQTARHRAPLRLASRVCTEDRKSFHVRNRGSENCSASLAHQRREFLHGPNRPEPGPSLTILEQKKIPPLDSRSRRSLRPRSEPVSAGTGTGRRSEGTTGSRADSAARSESSASFREVDQ
jgi:hypothetical protein